MDGRGPLRRVSTFHATHINECTINTDTVISSSPMNQLTVVAPSGLGSAHDGSQDAKLVELWLSLKTSSHTQRAYAAEAARFLAFRIYGGFPR